MRTETPFMETTYALGNLTTFAWQGELLEGIAHELDVVMFQVLNRFAEASSDMEDDGTGVSLSKPELPAMWEWPFDEVHALLRQARVCTKELDRKFGFERFLGIRQICAAWRLRRIARQLHSIQRTVNKAYGYGPARDILMGVHTPWSVLCAARSITRLQRHRFMRVLLFLTPAALGIAQLAS